MTGLYDVPRLYDLMCPMLAEGDAELTWWRGACGEGAAVLELGAGTGRVAIPLARGGLDVTALDRSAAMIGHGQARAAEAGVTLTWAEGDMTAFELPRRFDAIVIALNTLLHLHTRVEHEALFAAVRRHLAPGGRLALSVLSPDPRTLSRPPSHWLELSDGLIDDPEGGRFAVQESIDYDHATQRTRGWFRFHYPGRDEAVVVPVDLRMIYPAELEALVHHHGFEIVERHGDWDGAPFTSASLVQNLIVQPRAGR